MVIFLVPEIPLAALWPHEQLMIRRSSAGVAGKLGRQQQQVVPTYQALLDNGLGCAV